jgi:hypothetical protein
MIDYDFWKKQYSETWTQSSEREMVIAKYLEEQSGKKIELVGLGAGSAAFLSGSASQRGHTKGDADLVVVGTTTYLEVTGPLVRSVAEDKALWIRPDKVANAREKRDSQQTWVVHHLPSTDLIRVVPLGQHFWAALDADEFPLVTIRIRGAQERYYEIPATHRCVRPCSFLIDKLKKL